MAICSLVYMNTFKRRAYVGQSNIIFSWMECRMRPPIAVLGTSVTCMFRILGSFTAAFDHRGAISFRAPIIIAFQRMYSSRFLANRPCGVSRMYWTTTVASRRAGSYACRCFNPNTPVKQASYDAKRSSRKRKFKPCF